MFNCSNLNISSKIFDFFPIFQIHKIVSLSSFLRKEAEKQSNCIAYSKQTSIHKFICLIFMEYLPETW